MGLCILFRLSGAISLALALANVPDEAGAAEDSILEESNAEVSDAEDVAPEETTFETDGAPDLGDIDAHAIARASAEHVAALQAFAFNWFESYDLVIEGREKLTFMRSGQNIIRRGEGFISYAELGDRRRDYYYDGKLFTISAPEEDFFATAPFEGTFGDLVDEAEAHTGTTLPLWSLMSENLPDRLSPDGEGVLSRYVGLTRLAGQPVHHLSFATEVEDWQLWISTDETAPLPLKIVGTNLYEQGWPQYRVYLFDWEIDPELEDGAFTFVPDEDDRPVAMPEFDADRDPPVATDGATQ